MTTTETINIGRLHFRIRPWHSDSSIAHVAMAPGGGVPDRAEIAECLSRIRDLGYRSALTSAMDTAEGSAYRSLGFTERDRLRVMRHDLTDLDQLKGHDRASGYTCKRARKSDKPECLDIDSRAFEPFWRLDAGGLADAEAATPSRRFRVILDQKRVIGYAVTGRGGQQGFIQRLATDPDLQRRGVASLLVVDALRWCGRRHAREVFVNTQVSNVAATRLYEKLGFVTTPNDLVVLFWSGD